MLSEWCDADRNAHAQRTTHLVPLQAPPVVAQLVSSASGFGVHAAVAAPTMVIITTADATDAAHWAYGRMVADACRAPVAGAAAKIAKNVRWV